VLLKQVVEDMSGVTKIIHNLKKNTYMKKKCDFFHQPCTLYQELQENMQQTSQISSIILLQFSLVGSGAVCNCYNETAAQVQTGARECFGCLLQKLNAV
jgi:hypothetical protein